MRYKITATFKRDGQRQTCNSPEVLGEAYGRTWATEREALLAANELQYDIEEGFVDLDPSTVYDVSHA